mmetsp:Transcript_115425/g.322670  ORF Transcript_115425/g.322670 Transcript_115425/m.322670 type:complete len:212 (+) Transcript_115425:81-716(+)
MYLMVNGFFFSLKRASTWSFNQGPMSISSAGPPKSLKSERVQPSDTAMTAYPFAPMRVSQWSKTFSKAMSISGNKQMSTLRAAKVDSNARNPLCMPANLTMPMQFALHVASTYAAVKESRATVQAVSKPNVRSTKGMSLLMVAGIAKQAQEWLTPAKAVAICNAPRNEPSPPSTKSCLTPFSCNTLAASAWSGCPRRVFKMVPPRWWMFCT